MVLEDLPDDATEDELSDFFPDARTVIILRHDADMKGFGQLVYLSCLLAVSF